MRMKIKKRAKVTTVQRKRRIVRRRSRAMRVLTRRTKKNGEQWCEGRQDMLSGTRDGRERIRRLGVMTSSYIPRTWSPQS
jgi:hypothetical protein